MAMNKKGIIFLALSVIFVVLFGLVYMTQNSYRQENRQEVITNRIHTMDDFVKNLDKDIDRAAYISGFRALIGVEEYLSEKGTFFSNKTILQNSFRIIFLNGTYNETTIAVMEDASFTDYLTKIATEAQKIGLLVDINVTNVLLQQNTPWNVEVLFISNFNISNVDNQFWWSYQKNFTTEIAILGLKDPLYTVNTLGRVPNTINQYNLPVEGYVNLITNDTTTLQEFVKGSYYAHSTQAPSFIQRFTNNLTPSENGIESFVNLPALEDQGITVKTDRSVIDHTYFSTNPDTSTDRCVIDHMQFTPDWFRIELGRMDDYAIDSFNSTACS